MSVTFANVSAITIPQGDVTKITETITGKVLWEKVQVDVGYPRMYVGGYSTEKNSTQYCTMVNGTSYHDSYITAQTPYWNLTSLMLSAFSSFPRLKVGDTFTAYYVNNGTERTNWSTQSHLVTDAAWSFSNITLQGTNMSNKHTSSVFTLTNSTFPVTLSSTSGSSVKIASIKSSLSEYVNTFENLPVTTSTVSSYYPKSEYPYIYMSFHLKATSQALGGIMVDDHIFHAYIAR